jgi:hypothetical protein
LRFFLPRCGHINLVPIDYFTAAVFAVMECATPAGIYHLTSDSPKSFDELAVYCLVSVNGARLNPPEALFAKFLEPYLPYLADTRHFERRSALSLSPPEFTYDISERCMNYAKSVGWGNGPSLPATV